MFSFSASSLTMALLSSVLGSIILWSLFQPFPRPKKTDKAEGRENLTNGSSEKIIRENAGLGLKHGKNESAYKRNETIEEEIQQTKTIEKTCSEFIISIRVCNPKIAYDIISYDKEDDDVRKKADAKPNSDCRTCEHQLVENDIIIKIVHENKKACVNERKCNNCRNEQGFLAIRQKTEKFINNRIHENKKFSDAQK